MKNLEAKRYLKNYYDLVEASYKNLHEAKQNLENLDKLGFNVKNQLEKTSKMLKNLSDYEHDNLDFTSVLLKKLEKR